MPELNKWDMADFLEKHTLVMETANCRCEGIFFNPRYPIEEIWKDHASHQAVALYNYLTGREPDE